MSSKKNLTLKKLSCKNFGNNTVIDVLPQAGRVVIFDPEIEHEVLPTTRERLSVACWLRHS